MSQNFDESVVKKMAHLARLDLSREEIQQFGPQIQKILGYVSVLDEVSTQNVEPLYSVTEFAQTPPVIASGQSPVLANGSNGNVPNGNVSNGVELVHLAAESMADHYLVSKVIADK